MDQIQLTDYAQLIPADRARLREIVGAHTSLERVLNWGRSLTPPRDLDGILTQDEYTHDVVIRWDQELFLVYDTT
ncbi:MAG: hypothetical protein ABJC74_13825 [Gemmatimonadota bacterium]